MDNCGETLLLLLLLLLLRTETNRQRPMAKGQRQKASS